MLSVSFDIHRLLATDLISFLDWWYLLQDTFCLLWTYLAIPRFIERALIWMELTSSKLRLASSVSSDISVKGSHLRKRQIILIVVFVGLISASGGFLLGYFLKGSKTNKVNKKDDSAANSTDDQRSHNRFNTVSKAFLQFEEEVSASELRENLRWVDTLWIVDGIYSYYC